MSTKKTQRKAEPGKASNPDDAKDEALQQDLPETWKLKRKELLDLADALEDLYGYHHPIGKIGAILRALGEVIDGLVKAS